MNEKCGADYVQKEKVLPKGMDAASSDAQSRLASIDGDADRLVFFFLESVAGDGGKDEAKASVFRLLDGDKMTTIISDYIMSLLKDAGIPLTNPSASSSSQAEGKEDDKASLSIGAVQTAYANGASTKYLTEVCQLTPLYL